MSQSKDHQNGHQHGRANGATNGSVNGQTNGPTNGEKEQSRASGDATAPHYPLSDHPDRLKSAGGRTLDSITLEAVAQGQLTAADLQVGPETLLAQAEIARRAGFRELAGNLTRAAELTAVPNQELLRMYEQLRPHRSTFVELMELAHKLATDYGATATAEFVREAAQVYQTRNLLRRE